MDTIMSELRQLNPRAKTQAKSPSRRPPLPAADGAPDPSGVTGLDPTVVKSALDAGIASPDLQKVANLLGVPSKLKMPETDFPAEAIDCDDEADEGGEAPPGQEKTLTQILSRLTTLQEKSQTPKQSNLEHALDPETTSARLGAGRSGTVAWMAVQSEIEENAETIVKILQSRMGNQNGEFGVQKGTNCPCPYFWAEHRSECTDHQTNLNWTWIICAIVHSLQQGKTQTALARSLLALAGAEQVARDRGGWTLAWEMQFLEEPPYQRFQRSQSSTPSRTSRLPYSKLIDPRWGEAIMSRLKEIDDTRERMKKLQPPRTDYSQEGKPPKGGGKGKGKEEQKG